MAPELKKELYSPKEVAQMIGKGHLYVLRKINDGSIEAHKPYGNNQWAITRGEVSRILGVKSIGTSPGLGNDGPDEHSSSTEIPSGRVGNAQVITVPEHLAKYLEEPSQEPPLTDEDDEEDELESVAANPSALDREEAPPGNDIDPAPQRPKKRKGLLSTLGFGDEEEVEGDMEQVDINRSKGSPFGLDFDF